MSREQAPDDVLREAPARLESLRSEIIAVKERLRPKFVEAKDRFEKLGPAPDETKPRETPETALQRQKLDAEYAAIDGLMKRANLLLVRVDQLIVAANVKTPGAIHRIALPSVPGLFQRS